MKTPKYLTPGLGLAIRMIYPIRQEVNAIRRYVERFLALSLSEIRPKIIYDTAATKYTEPVLVVVLNQKLDKLTRHGQ